MLSAYMPELLLVLNFELIFTYPPKGNLVRAEAAPEVRVTLGLSHLEYLKAVLALFLIRRIQVVQLFNQV